MSQQRAGPCSRAQQGRPRNELLPARLQPSHAGLQLLHAVLQLPAVLLQAPQVPLQHLRLGKLTLGDICTAALIAIRSSQQACMLWTDAQHPSICTRQCRDCLLGRYLLLVCQLAGFKRLPAHAVVLCSRLRYVLPARWHSKHENTPQATFLAMQKVRSSKPQVPLPDRGTQTDSA